MSVERIDGYTNMLNKVGTIQDNSTAYHYMPEYQVDDVTLSNMYVDNGMFAKAVDRPSEDAVSRGIDLSDFGDEIGKKVKRKLDSLGWRDAMTTAEKWSRLFGGAIIVMLVNDGRGIDEPLDWKSVTKVEELIVFERAIVNPDYSHFGYNMYDQNDCGDRPFNQPAYYDVFSQYGQFRVHYTRCLVFRNGKFPEFAATEYYRYWGVPIYYRIHDAIREVITGHHDAVKLLERSTVGIYKMKGLSQVLSTEEGENKTLRRLQAVDMSRNILNSLAIDADGEDYSYISTSMGGVSDILDKICNMVSAVTSIPQTILFGGSPKGEDATGDNDMENYYQLLTTIQEENIKPATQTLISLILKEFQADDEKFEVPEYEVKFNSYRQMSDAEKAGIENDKATAEKAKAETAKTYIENKVLSPMEVRRAMANESGYDFSGIIDEKEAKQEVPDPHGEEQQGEQPDMLQGNEKPAENEQEKPKDDDPTTILKKAQESAKKAVEIAGKITDIAGHLSEGNAKSALSQMEKTNDKIEKVREKNEPSDEKVTSQVTNQEKPEEVKTANKPETQNAEEKVTSKVTNDPKVAEVTQKVTNDPRQSVIEQVETDETDEKVKWPYRRMTHRDKGGKKHD